MAMNPFPPQAYTRETMITAFQWLQTQSPQIRELATTPDLLISLYQKAQIQGKDALERPQLQNFKSELRNLAGMMGEFDTSNPEAGHPPTNAHAMPLTSMHTGAQKPAAGATFHAGTATTTSQNPAATAAQQGWPTAAVNNSTKNPDAVHMNGSSFILDSKSSEWLEEIQRELNLESPSEALRLALSVGYGRLSELFPRRR